MPTINKKENAICVAIGDEVIELKGEELKEFEEDRKQMEKKRQLLEAEYKAKQEARENAIKKLAEVAGLSEAEINAIL